ncbi:MAG: hypothetical protein VCA36_10420, partial [Opitutales bacterium]
MIEIPEEGFAGVEGLEESLSEPSEALVADMADLAGDWVFIGAGGKMGPTMVRMAGKALERTGSSSQVFAVSRFS